MAQPGVAPRPERFIEVLGPAVHQAAAIAHAMEGRARNRPKWGEASDVKAALTLADCAAQEAVLVSLLAHFPEVCLAAEEDTPSAAAFPATGPARVVVDPIDGTLHSYLEQRGPYACMVGLCVAGRFEAGIVALPREGLFLDGRRGAGARRTRPRGTARPWRAQATGARVLVSYNMPGSVVQKLQRAGYEVAFGCGGAISVAPLIPGVRAGLRLANTNPEGVSIRGRVGLCIARAAGALVTTESGAAFPEEVTAPAPILVVAAEQQDVALLQEAVHGVLETTSAGSRVPRPPPGGSR